MWHPAADTDLARWRHTSVDVLANLVENLPSTPVPVYAPWTVRDLVVHVIGVFGNAALSLRSGSLDKPRPELVVTPGSEPALLAAALRDALVSAERELEACPYETVWAPVGPRPPRFWARRMLREAVLHRIDAEEGRGTPSLPDEAVAHELIDEFVDSEVGRIAAAQADAPPCSFALETGTHTWRIGFGEGAEERLAAPGRASAAADPAVLWLWLMRRDPLPGAVTIDDPDGSVARFVSLIDAINRPA